MYGHTQHCNKLAAFEVLLGILILGRGAINLDENELLLSVGLGPVSDSRHKYLYMHQAEGGVSQAGVSRHDLALVNHLATVSYRHQVSIAQRGFSQFL